MVDVDRSGFQCTSCKKTDDAASYLLPLGWVYETVMFDGLSYVRNLLCDECANKPAHERVGNRKRDPWQ